MGDSHRVTLHPPKHTPHRAYTGITIERAALPQGQNTLATMTP